MTASEVVVLRFRDRRIPRALADLPVVTVDESTGVDVGPQTRRFIVVGAQCDLATVLARLLRTDRLDVEVGVVGHRWQARRARRAQARRVPLIRDETGAVIVEAALWLPSDDCPTITGEAVVDDSVLFDGVAPGVRIEPLTGVPGLRARVLTGRLRRRRWVTGRAVQLGTTGALVVRDGVPGARPVRRSTFYRHTTGWLRAG